MQLDTTMSIDLEKVKELIESDKFIQFLLDNTTDFGVAAYILQTLHEQVIKDKALLNKVDN